MADAICSAAGCDEPQVLRATVTRVENVLGQAWPPQGFNGELHFGWCERHADIAGSGLLDWLAVHGTTP